MDKKILIVEDNLALRQSLVTKVSELYEVVEAGNGFEALEKFQSEKPDLVMLDIIIPGKTGFEVLEEIRMKLNSQVPVIILSNLEDKETQKMKASLGIVDYIIKSNLSLEDLMKKINQTLGI